jgi:hypothetical protein
LAPTVGIAATGFCYSGGILQLFHREDQQILRLQQQPDRFNKFSDMVIIDKIFVNNLIASALQDSSGFLFFIGSQQLARPKKNSVPIRSDGITFVNMNGSLLALIPRSSDSYLVRKNSDSFQKSTQCGHRKLFPISTSTTAHSQVTEKAVSSKRIKYRCKSSQIEKERNKLLSTTRRKRKRQATSDLHA